MVAIFICFADTSSIDFLRLDIHVKLFHVSRSMCVCSITWVKSTKAAFMIASESYEKKFKIILIYASICKQLLNTSVQRYYDIQLQNISIPMVYMTTKLVKAVISDSKHP